jgi:hypothetical protein
VYVCVCYAAEIRDESKQALGYCLLKCFYSVVTVLLHCCYTVVTLLYCCHTGVTLLLHFCCEELRGGDYG